MSAIDELFNRLRGEGRKALMPFVTAGDPDLDFTGAVLREIVSRGAALCEVGIPYSDPIADGPVIQASYTRALANDVRLAKVFELLGRLTPELPAPLVTMVSYAIVHRHGPEQYLHESMAAGIAGAIVPDLPVDESDRMVKLCRAVDFDLIQLVTPTTSRERALRIAETSSGFLYYVSVTGITGERTEIPRELVDNVGWLREQTSLPICIGFGISQPQHVRRLKVVADGLIVGSAIVRRIAATAEAPRDQVVSEVGRYVASLVAALEEPSPHD